jgi:hypothetical protein
MPGLKFTTNLDPDSLYKIAFRHAQDLGYTVRDLGGRAFSATAGNAALNVLSGALHVHCDFRVAIHQYDDGNELVLERNAPWWTGMIGVSRVKSKAAELIGKIKEEVHLRGCSLMREKEF